MSSIGTPSLRSSRRRSKRLEGLCDWKVYATGRPMGVPVVSRANMLSIVTTDQARCDRNPHGSSGRIDLPVA